MIVGGTKVSEIPVESRSWHPFLGSGRTAQPVLQEETASQILLGHLLHLRVALEIEFTGEPDYRRFTYASFPCHLTHREESEAFHVGLQPSCGEDLGFRQSGTLLQKSLSDKFHKPPGWPTKGC